jgi:SH3-like domain-containing protein
MLTARTLLFPALFAAVASTFLLGLPGETARPGRAEAAQPVAIGPSGLPLPRFVSLKPDRVNLRVGPGRDYAVSWLYLKPGLPVEVVQEFDHWRRVRDADGTEGWVYQSLLSGRRTVIAAPWQRGHAAFMNLRGSPDETSSVVAHVEPGAIGTVRDCTGTWCKIEFPGVTGWLVQTDLWGAYPGERISG